MSIDNPNTTAAIDDAVAELTGGIASVLITGLVESMVKEIERKHDDLIRRSKSVFPTPVAPAMKTTPTNVSVYSYLGTPLQLVLEDKIAEGFNRFTDAFLQAQIKHEKLHGRKWSPEEDILIGASGEDHDAYDFVARTINALIEINGGSLDVTVDQVTSDHLEKVESLS